MLSGQELLLAVLLPMVVSSIFAAIGAWRKWKWMMPLAAGLAFLISYTVTLAVNHFSVENSVPGVPREWYFLPKLPPVNGTDWLYWFAIPLIVLGVVDALVGKGWGFVLGAFAAVVAYVTLHPLLRD